MSSTSFPASADSPSALSGREDSAPSPSARLSHIQEPSSQSTGLQSPALMMSESSQPQMSDQSMLFAEDSPAKTSARQAKGPELGESAAAYGKNTADLLANYDQGTSSWRTSQHCLLGGLESFSETWPRSGTMRSGIAYQLPPLVPLTAGTDSGLLPTPMTTDYRINAGQPSSVARKSPQLGAIVGMFPTPTSRDWKGAYSEKSQQNKPRWLLPDAVKMWPTPQASDNRDRGNLSSGAIKRRVEKGKQIMLSQSVSELNGALNPTWVEWLMGFPLGWTDLKDSATPLSRKSRKSSGEQSYKQKGDSRND